MTDTLAHATPQQGDSRLERIFEDWNFSFTLEPEFPIDQIENLDGQQVRHHKNIANERFVDEYLQQFENGAQFPPIVLRASDRSMIDGNTRTAMFRKAKATTVAVYLVKVPTLELARSLGAALNQMGGVRLTPDESAQQGLIMIEEGTFTDSQIARIVGRSKTQVTRWRAEQDFKAHASRLDLVDQAVNVADSNQRSMAKVTQDRPFSELVKLVSGRKVQHSEVKDLVDKVIAAPSEEAAVEVITTAGAAMRPTGPAGAALVRNRKANRMRMVLPQMLNLAPPEELYEADRAEEDRKAWLHLSNLVSDVLEMYERHAAAGMP